KKNYTKDDDTQSDIDKNTSENKTGASYTQAADTVNKQDETSEERPHIQNKDNIQEKNPNTNAEDQIQQGNRPFGVIPPKGMTSEEYEQLLNEQVQKIANENNHSIETPMGTFTPNNQNENPGQNQKIDLNSMPAGDFSTEGMSEEAQNEIDKLTRQKDFEGLSQEKHNDSLSEIMNDEINKN